MRLPNHQEMIFGLEGLDIDAPPTFLLLVEDGFDLISRQG
jgi:hypothetical protein